jgi:hypothetical protein
MNTFALDEIDRDLEVARARLDAFERSRTASDYIARLKASSPLHPFLVARAGAGFIAAGGAAAGLIALVTPYLSRDAATALAQLDVALGFPLFVAGLLLACCGMVMSVTAHFMAIGSGKEARLMPHEARTHQRLVSDVQQLEARKRTSTPAPARSRIAG